MLTVKQPQTYGYKSVHDLPTPPSASRLSPTLSHQDSPSRQTLNVRRSNSPITQPMSTPHRGLPPPAAMALPPHHHQQQQQQQQQHHHHQQQQQQQQQPPPPPPPPSTHTAAHHHHQHQHPHSLQSSAPTGSAPSHPTAASSWNSLPAPPSQWQGAEESMRNWLQTRAEEEKTRQEEEKTRQETLRLEQRKIEADMLRTSLGGGVPPQMVPLVFAGMGGGGMLSQAALEWAQQMLPTSQGHQLQLMAPQAPVSPHHQREHSGQGYSAYGGPGAPGAGQTAGSNQQQLAGSPIRARAQTTTTSMGPAAPQGSGLPSLNTSANAAVPHPSQAHSQLHGPPGQQDASASIYFHHWQPPATQASGSSNRPGTPSGESSRKRKATSTGQSGGTSEEQTPHSPTTFSSSNTPLPHSRKSHKRQRSDLSWHRPSSSIHDRAEGAERVVYEEPSSYAAKERSHSEVGKHSVSSLLSSDTADKAAEGKASFLDNPPHSAPATASSRAYRTGD